MASGNAKSEVGRVWNTGHGGHIELYLSLASNSTSVEL